MTQRLRMACVGLSAFWLPACSGLLNRPSEPEYVQTGPSYVVVNRTNGPHPVGSRKQIAEGHPTADDLALNPGPQAPPAPMTKGVQQAQLKQPDDVPTPDATPTIPQTLSGLESPLLKPPVGPANPWDTDKQIKAPPWPNFGGGIPMEEPTSKLIETPSILETAPVIPTTKAAPTAPMPDPPQPLDSASLKIDSIMPPMVTAPAKPAPLPVPTVTTASGSTNETLLVLAVKSLQNNKPEEAAAHLKNLESVNQEALLYLLPLLMRLSEGNLNALPPEELAMLIDRLNTVSGMLKSKASLRADRVCFCKGVRKFADVDPYDAKHEFRPGDMVFLYAELKNFTCEPVTGQSVPYNPNQRGCHIRLGTTLELRDARNTLVWRTDLNKTDFAQTPPHDYYHTYRFCVPDKLPAGLYTLWLNVVDKPTGRAVRKPIEMRIGQS